MNVLKEARLKRDMTKVEVASKACMADSLYSLLENGKRRLNENNARKLAPVFDMKWYELIDKMREQEGEQNDTQGTGRLPQSDAVT